MKEPRIYKVTTVDVEMAALMLEIEAQNQDVQELGFLCRTVGHCRTCSCAEVRRDNCEHRNPEDCLAAFVGASSSALSLYYHSQFSIDDYASGETQREAERCGTTSTTNGELEHMKETVVMLHGELSDDFDAMLEAAALLRDGWLPYRFSLVES